MDKILISAAQPEFAAFKFLLAARTADLTRGALRRIQCDKDGNLNATDGCRLHRIKAGRATEAFDRDALYNVYKFSGDIVFEKAYGEGLSFPDCARLIPADGKLRELAIIYKICGGPTEYVARLAYKLGLHGIEWLPYRFIADMAVLMKAYSGTFCLFTNQSALPAPLAVIRSTPAEEILAAGYNPTACTRRDLEILAHSRMCETCGAVWEAADYAAGCPNCANTISKERVEKWAEKIGAMTSGIDDIVGEMDIASED